MPQQIAIVGGGLSGLATAYYLQALVPDVAVSLFEASQRVGGVIRTEVIESPQHGRFVLDHGADMFAVRPTAALDLCRDLGVEDRLVLPDVEKAGAMIVHRGKLVPIPDGFVLMRATKPWQMLSTPLLSLRGKLRFIGERFVRHELSGDVSVAEFVRRRMGSEVLDRLVGPLVAGIYTADVEQLSLEATMAPISQMVREHGSLAKATLARRKSHQDDTERSSAGARYAQFRGFPGGMQELIDRLSEAISQATVRLQSPVERLERDPDGGQKWNLQIQGGSSGLYDNVILTTPAGVTARLLRTVQDPSLQTNCRRAADDLASIQYASTAIVVLAVRKSNVDRLPDRFGFVVPIIENRRILAASFASHKYPIRCPEDHVILRVFVGGALQGDLLKLGDDELIELVREEMAELIGLHGDASIARVVRWNDAMPQYHVGHLDRVERIEAAIGEIPGLDLMSNALRGVGIAPVIGAAKALAKRLAG